MTCTRLPHSEIPGLTVVCTYPRLIAAYVVSCDKPRLFAPTRGLSQLTTSFIAFLCQGIHRVPLLA